MFLRFIKVFSFFLISVLLFKLRIKGKNVMLFYCGKSFNRASFRYPSNCKSDFFISIRIFKRIFISIFQKRKLLINYNSNSRKAIFDGSLNSSELRFNYIEKYSGYKNELIISKENLLNYYSLKTTFFISIFLIFSFLPILFFSIFSNNKLYLPLLVREFLECFILQEILINNKIKELNYFHIYERDSNIVAYILMRSGIYINKIPSEVPLCFWNKIVVADQLSFCFQYQLEEFEAFHKNMFVEKTQLWAPERILEAPQFVFNKNKDESNPKYNIGFYSSGYWLREKKGHISLSNFKEIEELLLMKLIEYATINKITLRIYPHPLEKHQENQSITREYYLKKTLNSNISIANLEVPSINSFNEVDLGISIISTLMYERIFLGYKTLLFPLDTKFPLINSSLNNICVSNSEELFNKINAVLNLKTSEYFRKFDIYKYANY